MVSSTHTIETDIHSDMYRYEQNPDPGETVTIYPNIMYDKQERILELKNKLIYTFRSGFYMMPIPSGPDFYQKMNVQRPEIGSYSFTTNGRLADDCFDLLRKEKEGLLNSELTELVKLIRQAEVIIDDGRTIDGRNDTPLLKVTTNSESLKNIVLRQFRCVLGKVPKEKRDIRIKEGKSVYTVSPINHAYQKHRWWFT